MYKNIDDEDLMIEIAGGNDEAFEELYNRYEKIIYSQLWDILKNTQEINDVFQEIILTIHSKAGKYDPKLGKVSTFINGIIVKQSLNYLRNMRARKKVFVEEEHLENISDPKNIEVQYENKSLFSLLIEHLKSFSLRDRYVLKLRLQGLQFSEIGKILNITDDSARVSSYRTIKTLKERLGSDSEILRKEKKENL